MNLIVCNFSKPTSDSSRICFFKTVAIVCLGLWFLWSPIQQMVQFNFKQVALNDSQAGISLNMAITGTLCHKMSYVHHNFFGSATPNQGLNLARNQHQSILEYAIAQSGGTVEKFCAPSQFEGTEINNENTLSWIMQGIFYLFPNCSLSQLAIGLFAIQLFFCATATFFILSIGSSIVFAFFGFFWALQITPLMMPEHIIGLYPFLHTSVLMLISCFGLALLYNWHKCAYQSWFPWILFSIFLGAASFYFINLRTSYTMIVLLVVGWFWVYLLLMHGFSKALLVQMLVTSLTIFGFWKFVLLPIEPPNASNMSRHTIFHPILLGLNVPQNAFAISKGIDWNDGVGARLAATVDPKAPYLSPAYDRALRKVYFSLWKTYPKEMVSVYLLKARAALDSIQEAAIGPTVSHILQKWHRHGLWFWVSSLWIFLGIPLWFLKNSAQLTAAARFSLVAFALAGMALYLEEAAIMPYFVPQYHAYVFLYFRIANIVLMYFLGAWTYSFFRRIYYWVAVSPPVISPASI